jgi:lipopolysaccharide export system protein LptA
MLHSFTINNKLVSSLLLISLLVCIVYAQSKPKQLRKEVLQSQNPGALKSPKSKTKAQVKAAPAAPAQVANPLSTKNSTLVYLENSESLSFDKLLHPDVQVLKGNVRFKHENMIMYCDSAYFYEGANSLDAFGHVKINQADTLFVYGDVLYYDGNTKLARLRRSVRMENRKTVLTTDSLNYNRASNLAYYYTGGKIVDDVNTLTSIWGQYSPSTNQALFKTNVHLVNKNFTLESDTLKYNTKTNVANLVGKSHIIYNKETDIYSTRGWYNTSTERMMLLDRSVVVQKDGKTMTGDTIFYDKKMKYGEGFSKVVMNDTAQKSTLKGNYVSYLETSKRGLATDSALLIDWSSKDTMYVHGDTLYTAKDSIYDTFRGFSYVRFFRNDVQGLCDSLKYSARDSVLNLYGQPVVWSDNNQLSGAYIKVLTKNKKVDQIHVKGSAFATQNPDSIFFNQVSGKEMIAYMDSSQLKRVWVKGNAETIYYPQDDKDSTIIGMNKSKSSFVNMYFLNKKIKRVVLTTASNGSFSPLSKVLPKDAKLKNFFWLEDERPIKVSDVFIKFAESERPRAVLEEESKDAEGDDSTNQPVEKLEPPKEEVKTPMIKTPLLKSKKKK